jgi:hypothetical protein
MASQSFLKGFFYNFLGKMFPNSQIDDEYVQALAAVSDPNTPAEERQKHLEVIKCRIPSNSENSSSVSNKLGDEVSKAACATEEIRIQNCIKEKHIEIPADASTAKRLMLSWENAISAIDCQDSDVVNGYKALGKKTREFNANLKSFITTQFGILQADVDKNTQSSPATSPATSSPVTSSPATSSPVTNTKGLGVTSLSNSNSNSNSKSTTGVMALSNSNSKSNVNSASQNTQDVKSSSTTTPATTTPPNNDSGSTDENLAKARRVLKNISADISACLE